MSIDKVFRNRQIISVKENSLPSDENRGFGSYRFKPCWLFCYTKIQNASNYIYDERLFDFAIYAVHIWA